MSAYTAIFGAVALGFVMAAPAAGAVTHPQFTPVSYSGHEGVVRAAKRIHLDSESLLPLSRDYASLLSAMRFFAYDRMSPNNLGKRMLF